MFNLITIDVEEWFHTTALDPYVGMAAWDSQTSGVVPNVRRLLEIFERHQTQATFFVLGWVAERYPNLVKEIAAHGHEIASHGYRHRLIYELSRATFRDYVHKSKDLLENLTGQPVLGYRATSFSIVDDTLWALDIIKEAGFIYDSSIFPIKHDIYGISGFPRFPFNFKNGLIEIPPSTMRIAGKNIPIAGGGYFRLFPYWITKNGLQSLNRAGYPAMVYLHPWELDPHCPRIKKADLRTRFRQYINLNATAKRLEKLLSDFNFLPIIQYVDKAGLRSNLLAYP
jgi:polysaccharide deacetylase family protein (PEP-CTERM system associated)